jgi:beta-hydroxyacyl-ACP dehydratase FabZ
MPPFNITDIQNILPHRYPFLLIDKIIELEEDKRAVGIKNVTMNEYFFEGHFPGRPIMPGVLIVEAMAQVAGVLLLSKSSNAGKIAYFMSMNNVKFRKTVVPGDQLVFEVEIIKIKSKTGQVRTRASVDGDIVSEADLRFSLVKA